MFGEYYDVLISPKHKAILHVIENETSYPRLKNTLIPIISSLIKQVISKTSVSIHGEDNRSQERKV